MAATIKDIAKLANVSHTTVSRALNGSPLIKEETRRRILDLASQLNYIPDYNARSLVLRRSYSIGLFFTSISKGTSSSFFADTIRGVNSVIGVDYNLLVRGIDEYDDYSSIHRKRFDGMILMSQSETDNPFVYHVIREGIPLIILNRQMSGHGIVNVLSNDKEGAYTATLELIRMGHSRIALIEGVEGFKSTQERRDGFLNALMDHDLPVRGEYIVRGDYTMTGGSYAMEQLLVLREPPTAVFCSNDDMAIGAMNAIFQQGLQVPGDVSVVGFDDIGFSRYTTPALTTVKRPIEQISARGAEYILSLMNATSCKEEQVLLSTQLVTRGSVSAPHT
ncbi:LacI family DNA-binding transcriptional regulator [Paenibacillus sp. FSL K6-1230]|uniref:LacI family DNA-binding transcriptional regulator n=1 Tax=Paenibacillus sp. FSL K6-1230 TaxID=2921603 RepID=UPI0003A18165